MSGTTDWYHLAAADRPGGRRSTTELRSCWNATGAPVTGGPSPACPWAGSERWRTRHVTRACSRRPPPTAGCWTPATRAPPCRAPRSSRPRCLATTKIKTPCGGTRSGRPTSGPPTTPTTLQPSFATPACSCRSATGSLAHSTGRHPAGMHRRSRRSCIPRTPPSWNGSINWAYPSRSMPTAQVPTTGPTGSASCTGPYQSCWPPSTTNEGSPHDRECELPRPGASRQPSVERFVERTGAHRGRLKGLESLCPRADV